MSSRFLSTKHSHQRLSYRADHCVVARFWHWSSSIVLSCVVLHNVAAQPVAPSDTHLDPKLVDKLATVGLEFMVSTYKWVESDTKPWIKEPDAKEMGKFASLLLENYQAKLNDGIYGAQLLHGALGTAITASTAAGAMSGGGGPAAVAIGVIASSLNDKARDYLVSDVVEKASAALGAGIEQMSASKQSEIDALLKSQKFDEAAALFDAHSNSLATMRLQVAGDVAAEKLLEKAVNDSLRRGSLDALKIAGGTAADVANLQVKFTNHVRVVAGFTRRADAKFQKLNHSVEAMQSDLQNVKADLHKLALEEHSTALQVQIIQDVMFDERPASVKLQMLQSGAKPGLSAEQREKLIAALSIKVRQEEIVRSASAVVSYAEDIQSIMSNLGVKSDQRLDDAIRYGAAAQTALDQAFSGNYLGAVVTVTRLFGGGSKPDPMQENFKRIFAAFSEINNRLDQSISLQVKALEGLETVSKQISSLNSLVERRFDRVDFEVALLQQGIQNLVWKDLNVCKVAWMKQDEGGQDRYDIGEARFKSFEAMVSYTDVHGDKVYKCSDKLAELFESFRNQNFSGNPLSLAFVKTNFDSQSGGGPAEEKGQYYGRASLQYYEDSLYRPSFNVLLWGWARAQNRNAGVGGIANAYALLSTPASSPADLKNRLGILQSGSGDYNFSPCGSVRTVVGVRMRTYLCSDTSTYSEPADLKDVETKANARALAYLSEPMLRDQVGILIQYALFVVGPREIAKSDSTAGAYTISEILKQPARTPYADGLLTGALMISDASIAQQSMLYGDLTAWFIFELLWDAKLKRFRSAPADPFDQAAFADARKLLSNERNPWLQRNVLMLILQSVEKACISDLAGRSCRGRSLMYRLAFERYFQIEGEGSNARYAPLDDTKLTMAELALKDLLDVHPDTRFVIEDQVISEGKIISIPRRLQFKLDGYSLPMPSVAEWSNRSFSYPTMMRDRVMDRIRIAKRLANYTMLDKMDQTTRARLVSVLSQGKLP